MLVNNARNVEEALINGIKLIQTKGVVRESRAGTTIAINSPVTTVYHRPWERAMVNQQRDANPFFHLFEALWILAGRKDVQFLTEFNKRMGEYSDDGATFNAPYGFRMRQGVNSHKDQIEEVIKELQAGSDTRQAVLQIWDDNDLGKATKDKACNMSVVFRVRDERLDITVYNRSNDMIWGAYGANAVQFSMLQEYVAARVGIKMGRYYQVSNDFHVYLTGPGGVLWDSLNTANWTEYQNPYDSIIGKNLVLMDPEDMINFDRDLDQFFKIYDYFGYVGLIENRAGFQSEYFNTLVIPMLMCHHIFKQFSKENALPYIGNIGALDWRMAVVSWLENRKGVNDVIQ